MRELRGRQFKLGETPVGEIWTDPKSRDDTPALFRGLQHLYRNEELHARLFELLEHHDRPESAKTTRLRAGSCGISNIFDRRNRTQTHVESTATRFCGRHQLTVRGRNAHQLQPLVEPQFMHL